MNDVPQGATGTLTDDGSETGGGGSPVGSPWTMVTILSVLSFISLLDRQIFALAVDPIRQELGFSDLDIGVIQGLGFAAFYAMCGLPIGMLVDRFSRRKILLLGVGLWGVATALTGLATTFAQMFMARMALGLGEATVNPCSYTMIADRFSRDKLTVPMSVFSTAQIVGAGMSIVAGGTLLHWLMHQPPVILPLVGYLSAWRLMFLYAALPALMGIVLVKWLREPPRTRWSANVTPKLIPCIKAKWPVMLCHFCGFTAIQVMMATTGFWNLPYMARAFHWSPTQIGLGYGSMLLIVMICGNLIASRIIDRRLKRGARATHFFWFATCALLAIPLTLASYAATNPMLFLLPTAAYLALLAGYPAAAAASLQNLVSPLLRGRMTALYVMFSSVMGYGFGPMMVGLTNRFLFGDDDHLNGSLAILSAFSLTMGASFLFVGAFLSERVGARAQSL